MDHRVQLDAVTVQAIADDLQTLLSQAYESLTAAISCVETDPQAATDDMLSARLLIAVALLKVRYDR